MRSGTAARLAGLSPLTLRVWEHHYGVVVPPRVASGQRRYSVKDVERLRLIQRLTLGGRAIGAAACLDTDAMVTLFAGHQIASAGALRVLLVDPCAARQLEGRLPPAPAHVIESGMVL